MKLLALLVALAVERLRPMRPDDWVHIAPLRLADAVRFNFDADERGNGVLGWFIFVAIALVGVLIAQTLASVSGVLLFALHVVVLWYTVGLRRIWDPLDRVRVALSIGDLQAARRTLMDRADAFDAATDDVLAKPAESAATWTQTDAKRVADSTNMPGATHLSDATSIARAASARAILAAHRQMLAPVFYYLLLPGLIGPVLYRAAELLAHRWQVGQPMFDPESSPWQADSSHWGEFARRAFAGIEWTPTRLSALTFAVVGNFDDALSRWREASRAGAGASGLLVAATGGALGPAPVEGAAALEAVDRLILRAMLLAFGVALLVTFVTWLGS